MRFFRIKASCTLEFERLMTTKINLKFQLFKSFFPRVSDKCHSKKCWSQLNCKGNLKLRILVLTLIVSAMKKSFLAYRH